MGKGGCLEIASWPANLRGNKEVEELKLDGWWAGHKWSFMSVVRKSRQQTS